MDSLDQLNWIPVPNGPYVIKYNFCDDGYVILFSNLTSVYEEKMTVGDIEKRFNNFNPFVKMKPRVILDNLKKSLKNCLMGESDISLKVDETQVTITLNFHVGSVMCKYNIEMSLMAADKVMHYIIGPTVLGALLSQRKVLDLQKKMSSLENTKPLVLAKTVLAQSAIEPDWLKGKNVPAEVVCESFLKIQSHFKDLYAENYEAYSTSKKIKSENTSTAHLTSPPKKYKSHEKTNESNIDFMDEEDENKVVKKEEEHSNDSIDPPRTAARKKKVLKF